MSSEDRDYGFSGGVIIKFVFGFLFLALLVSFVWYFMKYQKAEQQIYQLTSEEGKQEVNQREIEAIVEKVSKHIILPENETPTVATIEDIDALVQQQSFFVGAQNGDKVLIYSNKAIVYNPERDVLVNVGPVYIQNNQVNTQPEVVVEEVVEEVVDLEENVETLDVEVRNGSTVQGVAQNLANSLADEDNYNVVRVVNAVTNDYTGTILVNLGEDDVSDLEQSLGVTAVNVMPEGETESSVKVVIIVGNQQ